MASGATPSFYRKLALVLGVGIAAGIVLALTDITGPGLLELESSIVGLYILVGIIVIILGYFLVRIGDIFSIEGKLKAMIDGEGEKWTASLRAEEAKAEALREQLRKDAAKTNQDVLKETASQRMRIDDANSAAVRAANEAQSALAQVAELKRRPEVSQEVVAVRADLAKTNNELGELRRRDNIYSPLVKELQEQVKALQAEVKKMGNRLGEALDIAEKREMEAAANRASLDAEVTDLRKREQILVLKARDLEDKNAALADAARKPRITFRDGEESQHVLMLEGIGNKYAARLNAIGIISIPQLVEARAADVATQLQVEPGMVEEWQGMGRLLPLSGIGPQAAELLAKAGIRSVQQLAAQDPLDLSLKCRELTVGKKVKITNLDVTPAVAKKWIEAARDGKFDAN